MFRLPLLAAALILCLSLDAQMMPFKNYGIKDGLNNNNVQAVIRDDRGLLWVGTDLGISWFDGKRFYQPPIKTNIGQLYVSGFYKDKQGTIWTLTFFNGIYKYQNGHFTNYLVDPLLKAATTNSITEMIQISDDKYVVVSQNVAYLFDGKKFSLFDPTSVLLKTKTNSVTQLGDGDIVFSTDAGALLYGYNKGHLLLKSQVLKYQHINKILVTQNQLWVLTANGLMTFKNDGLQLFEKRATSYVLKRTLKDITADKTGTVWAIADNDSFWASADTVFKIRDGRAIQYTTRNGLPENIQRIYCDHEGLVWFANRRGICMLGDEYYEFNTVVYGGYNNPVSSIIIDSLNNLWAGTINGLVLKKHNRYVFYHTIGKQRIGYVAWLSKNKTGSFLAGTEAGVVKIEGNGITKYLDIPSSVLNIDAGGNEWFGDVDGNVQRYDGKRLMLFKPNRRVSEMITALHVENNYLWVGYREKGIVRYEIKNDSLLQIKEYTAFTGYPDMRIRCCTTDTKGNIIWGTRTNGIFVFSLNTGQPVAHIGTENGLNANWVKYINYDIDRKLYLTTNNGIDIVTGDYKKPSVKFIKIDDDNINRETNCITRDGAVFYVGTNEGIIKWMPGNIRRDTVAPPIYFTKINIQGLKTFSTSPYSTTAADFTLTYDQHFISFEFAGISLKNPENVLYHYILTGQDNEWSPLTEHNDVAYNLKPGSYTFKVEAENADGMWSRRPAIFHFVIEPPFWQAWWFILLVAAILLLAAYSAYRYKLSKILALEMLRNKISTDLHDDIGSTLSSISILSDIAAREKEQKSKRILGEISERSHMLMEKMDDIVWSISSKNDTVGNLFSRIQQFASGVLEAKDIEYDVQIPEKIKEIKLAMQQRQHIYLILKEAINNLIKYSCCAFVNISADYSGGRLRVEIADDGKGFDLNKITRGNGLNNMQKRTEAMRGALDITTAPGKGTRVTLSVEIE